MIYGITLDIGGALCNLPGNPFKYTNIGVLLSKVLEAGLLIAALATFLYLLWGGFEWITSGGDKTGLENARNKVISAIVGIVVVFSVWAIFGVVQTFLGIKITGETNKGSGCGGANTQMRLTLDREVKYNLKYS